MHAHAARIIPEVLRIFICIFIQIISLAYLQPRSYESEPELFMKHTLIYVRLEKRNALLITRNTRMVQ